MFASPEILQMAAHMSSNAAARLAAVARNVANADTPGYHATDVRPFRESYQVGSALEMMVTRSDHLVSDKSGYPENTVRISGSQSSPDGNNVSLEDELARAAAIRSDHQLSLAVYKSALGILRTSLGRF